MLPWFAEIISWNGVRSSSVSWMSLASNICKKGRKSFFTHFLHTHTHTHILSLVLGILLEKPKAILKPITALHSSAQKAICIPSKLGTSESMCRGEEAAQICGNKSYIRILWHIHNKFYDKLVKNNFYSWSCCNTEVGNCGLMYHYLIRHESDHYIIHIILSFHYCIHISIDVTCSLWLQS